MNAELLKQIDILIEQSRSDVIRDTISLVNINSEKGAEMLNALKEKCSSIRIAGSFEREVVLKGED